MSGSKTYTEKELVSFSETVADLARNFAHAEFWPEDSREFTRLCHVWALEFETKHEGREWNGEYIEAIESFFDTKYNETRGLMLANPYFNSAVKSQAAVDANAAALPDDIPKKKANSK